MTDTDYPINDPAALKDMLVDQLNEHDEWQECSDERKRDRIAQIVNHIYDKYNGLTGTAGAVVLASKHLGHDLIDVMREDGFEPKHISIESLSSCDTNEDGFGMNNVRGTYNVRYVKKIDARDDWVRADVMIYDDSGSMELTLWNDMAEAMRDVQEDDELTIEGGYVKEDKWGRSLNIAKAGYITINDGDKVAGPDHS